MLAKEKEKKVRNSVNSV